MILGIVDAEDDDGWRTVAALHSGWPIALSGGSGDSGSIDAWMEQGASPSYIDESRYCWSTKLGEG
jgi:hypothetical protein